MNQIQTFLQVARQRGVLSALAILVSYVVDIRYEARHQTDTRSWVRIQDLEIDSTNKDQAVDYQPTQSLPLSKLLKTLDISKDRVFVDLGSGKGKALMIAADYGFTTLRGVEFSSELCRIARQNCKKYRRRAGQ